MINSHFAPVISMERRWNLTAGLSNFGLFIFFFSYLNFFNGPPEKQYMLVSFIVQNTLSEIIIENFTCEFFTNNLKLKVRCWGVVLQLYNLHSKSNAWFLSIEKGQIEPVEADSLTRELLNTNKCYILDCGTEVFVWMGRNTSLDERKSASAVAEVLPCSWIIKF